MKRYVALILAMVASAFCVSARAQSLTPVVTNDLNEPYGIAVDRTNKSYYITDSGNNRIVRISLENNTRTNLAGGDSGFVDGPGHLARFSSPQGIVAARGGFVVADSGNNRIRLVDTNGAVTTLAGASVGFADGTGANASFNNPAGLAADSAGNVYIADMNNNAIRKLDTSNNVTTLAPGSTVFRHPAAVAIGADQLIYVADSGNNSIRRIESDGSVSLFAGSGSSTLSGATDAIIATNARFSNPQGLLWIAANGANDPLLLVSDTDNGVLRRVYYNPSISGYSVDTLTNSVGAGLLSPVGLAEDENRNYLVVDLRGGSVQRINVSGAPPLPPPDPPRIGTVELGVDATGAPTTFFHEVTNDTFNNEVVVAIPDETGTDTFFTTDGTNPATQGGAAPPTYFEGQPNLPESLLQADHAVETTITAVRTARGRVGSDPKVARFRFKVANPVVVGANYLHVPIECKTANAVIRYTTDGSAPTTNSLIYILGSALSIRPQGTNDITLRVRAYKRGYEPSDPMTSVLPYAKASFSTVGIVRDFVGGNGATILVPVEVTPADEPLASLQFRVDITPRSPGAPPISDQMRVVEISSGTDYLPIPQPVTDTNVTLPYFRAYTDGSATRLAVGYFATNYTLHVPNKMTVAMLAIPIPPNAESGQIYDLALRFPSATYDGFEAPVPIIALPDRSITVSNVAYIVGDTALSTFYNAGDFGNGNLNNNDVNHAFYAALGVRRPYAFSDVFDAMDAWPEDTGGVVGGDGDIQFLDWNTILERSLRLSTINYSRTWHSGGFRVPALADLNLEFALPATEITIDTSGLAWQVEGTLSATHSGNIQPGATVALPVSLSMTPDHTLSGLQFRAAVVPSFGAPVVSGLAFKPAPGRPAPALSGSLPGTVLCGWPLESYTPRLAGEGNLLGYLTFTVPPDAKPDQYYAVRFYFPGGATRRDGQTVESRLQSLAGSVWVGGPVQKAPDVIADEWRMRFFGKLDSVFADAYADPDADGRNNLQEFLDGTNPADLRFHTQNAAWRNNPAAFKLRWYAKAGKSYVIESSADSVNGPWQPVSELLGGKGDLLDLDAPRGGLGSRFYRVREK